MGLTTKQQRRIYLAGIVDGEGSIDITRREPQTCRNGVSPAYSGRVTVEMTHKPTVRLLQETLGGIVSRRDRGSGRKLIWVWRVTDRSARKALKLLIAYMSVKRSQAEIVLGLRPSSKGAVITQEELEEKEAARQRIRELNRGFDS